MAIAKEPTVQNSPQRKRLRTVSAFVVCCNEEQNIRRCLESIKWCDEIVVVDSGSTDQTLAICNEYSAKVFRRPWPGFVEQKRFALQQCSSDWVLNIDADEEISPELRQEIEEILSDNSAGDRSCVGYYLPRVVFHLGRWWRKGGWHPEYRLRFSRRANTSWGGDDPHEKALVDGPTKRLHGELRHYTYTSLSDQVRSLNSHSSTAARSLCDNGVRFSLAALLLRPLSRFARFYLLKKGYREGLAGLIVGILEAYYVFLKYAKLWELEQQNLRLTYRGRPSQSASEWTQAGSNR